MKQNKQVGKEEKKRENTNRKRQRAVQEYPNQIYWAQYPRVQQRATREHTKTKPPTNKRNTRRGWHSVNKSSFTHCASVNKPQSVSKSASSPPPSPLHAPHLSRALAPSNSRCHVFAVACCGSSPCCWGFCCRCCCCCS